MLLFAKYLQSWGLRLPLASPSATALSWSSFSNKKITENHLLTYEVVSSGVPKEFWVGVCQKKFAWKL